MREEETLTNLDFGEEMKMIDICALGPLRVSASLINANLMKEGSKIIMITSQGGSVSWRTTQNPEGHDYGHHVSFFHKALNENMLRQQLHSLILFFSLYSFDRCPSLLPT